MNYPDKVHVYVDGSCAENRNVDSETRAGWGLCVIEGDDYSNKGKGNLVFESNGLVVTCPTEKGYLGAKIGSNNTAELSAVAHALRWVLRNAQIVSVTIRSDSNYALKIASGEWKAKANLDLSTRVRSLWDEVRELIALKGEHVHAHNGHRWNERADHLAFRAMQGEKALPLQFWKPGQR